MPRPKRQEELWLWGGARDERVLARAEAAILEVRTPARVMSGGDLVERHRWPVGVVEHVGDPMENSMCPVFPEDDVARYHELARGRVVAWRAYRAAPTGRHLWGARLVLPRCRVELALKNRELQQGSLHRFHPLEDCDVETPQRLDG